MARVTHVKSAQQRYKTVPVLGDDGKPLVRFVKRTRPTKRGKTEFTQRVTREDRTQPLPPLTCDFPGCQIDGGKIMPGTPYKWVKPKSGPYGGRQRNRHEQHPSWKPWDLSNSMGAQIERIQSEAWEAIDAADTTEDVEAALNDAAEQIRDLAEQKREAAQNIEDGFQHATYQSEELAGLADSLESWADEVEQVQVPDLPDPADADEDDRDDCEDCDGTGRPADALDGSDEVCETCSGTGKGDAPDEPTESQMDQWHDDVRDAASVLDESPA